MADNISLADLNLEVGLLKRDIIVFDKYFQKIDTTLEKLGDVTSQMTKMIERHEERLETSHDGIDDLEKKIDAQADKLSNLENRILVQLENRITAKIESFKTEVVGVQEKIKASTDGRLKRLELWRYGVVAGAMVLFFFASQFTKSYFDYFWLDQAQRQNTPHTIQK